MTYICVGMWLQITAHAGLCKAGIPTSQCRECISLIPITWFWLEYDDILSILSHTCFTSHQKTDLLVICSKSKHINDVVTSLWLIFLVTWRIEWDYILTSHCYLGNSCMRKEATGVSLFWKFNWAPKTIYWTVKQTIPIFIITTL